MFGKIKIFFGKVIDIEDDLKLNRCRIPIIGHTEKINSGDLPWYFPFYGTNYLPEIGDEVSIIIFDENFSTGFYGRKVNVDSIDVDSGDYNNYLEIFKREVSGNDVELIYKESTGIEFINNDGKIQIETDKLSLFVGSNSIVMDSNRIDIGDSGQEATILGDKGVSLLQDMIFHQANTITQMLAMFTAINTAASALPITYPISVALAPLLSAAAPALNSENQSVMVTTNTIQSRKVFIE